MVKTKELTRFFAPALLLSLSAVSGRRILEEEAKTTEECLLLDD